MEEHGICWARSPLAAGGISHLFDMSWAGFAKPQSWNVMNGCLGVVEGL